MTTMPCLKRHNWTEEERLIVRRDYRGTQVNVQAIARMLGVTEDAVRAQAAVMGIMRPRNPNWSPAEIRKLEKLIGRYSTRTIAKKLHRSVNAVENKTRRIGLRLGERDGWFTKTEVCEILGVSRPKVQQWIDIGALRASYHNGRKPRRSDGLGSIWHINTKAFRDFIIKHTDELQGRNVDLQQVVWIVTGKLE